MDLSVGPGYAAILAVPVVYTLAVLLLVLRAPPTPTTRWLIFAFAATTLVDGS